MPRIGVWQAGIAQGRDVDGAKKLARLREHGKLHRRGCSAESPSMTSEFWLEARPFKLATACSACLSAVHMQDLRTRIQKPQDRRGA